MVAQLQFIAVPFSSVLIFHEALRCLQIRLYHLCHEGIEVDLALPSKNTLGFGRVSKKKTAYKYENLQEQARRNKHTRLLRDGSTVRRL